MDTFTLKHSHSPPVSTPILISGRFLSFFHTKPYECHACVSTTLEQLCCFSSEVGLVNTVILLPRTDQTCQLFCWSLKEQRCAHSAASCLCLFDTTRARSLSVKKHISVNRPAGRGLLPSTSPPSFFSCSPFSASPYAPIAWLRAWNEKWSTSDRQGVDDGKWNWNVMGLNLDAGGTERRLEREWGDKEKKSEGWTEGSGMWNR